MAEKVSLPIVNKINAKDILVDAIKMYIKGLGELNAPIDVSKEYPGRETTAHDKAGQRVTARRRIVVKKLKNTPFLQAIGDNTTGTFNFLTDVNTTDDQVAAIKRMGYGWIDSYIFEISAWSTDSDDRDNLIELIKAMMLELTQGRSPGHDPYFWTRGILSVKFVSESDSVDAKPVGNSVVYSGNTTWNLIVPFINPSIDEFQRIKVGLIDSIINFPGDNTGGGSTDVVIVDPGDNGPGSGDGGNGTTNPSTPPRENPVQQNPEATLVISTGGYSAYKFKMEKSVIYVGSPSGGNTASKLSAFMELLKD